MPLQAYAEVLHAWHRQLRTGGVIGRNVDVGLWPGRRRRAIAVAASILTAVYHMLRDGTFFRDLGPDHFARYDKTRAAMRLVRRIKDLGYDVEIKAAA